MATMISKGHPCLQQWKCLIFARLFPRWVGQLSDVLANYIVDVFFPKSFLKFTFFPRGRLGRPTSRGGRGTIMILEQASLPCGKKLYRVSRPVLQHRVGLDSNEHSLDTPSQNEITLKLVSIELTASAATATCTPPATREFTMQTWLWEMNCLQLFTRSCLNTLNEGLSSL